MKGEQISVIKQRNIIEKSFISAEGFLLQAGNHVLTAVGYRIGGGRDPGDEDPAEPQHFVMVYRHESGPLVPK